MTIIQLNKKLQETFHKVKKDINGVMSDILLLKESTTSWLRHLNQEHKELEMRVFYLEQKLKQLENNIDSEH